MGRRTTQRRSGTRTALGLGSDDKVVLVVARHEYPKAVDVAIDAFAHLVQDEPSARLVIAGSNGSQTEVLYSAADRTGVTDRIQFLGARDDVADLMCAADVLCFPSRREGMPGTLIEAMALELPVVATDIAPNREVLGADATLVSVEDATALATALVQSLNRDQSAQTSDGRARFEQHFTIETSVERQVALYSDTITAGPGS